MEVLERWSFGGRSARFLESESTYAGLGLGSADVPSSRADESLCGRVTEYSRDEIGVVRLMTVLRQAKHHRTVPALDVCPTRSRRMPKADRA